MFHKSNFQFLITNAHQNAQLKKKKKEESLPLWDDLTLDMFNKLPLVAPGDKCDSLLSTWLPGPGNF